MLKILPIDREAFHNFKCGEIFCVTPTVYSVNCCMCGAKVAFGDFPNHFQKHHLTHESKDAEKDSLQKGETSLSPKDGIDSDFDIKSEHNDINDEESDTDISQFQQLEEEKPIEFLEVRLDKRRTRSFIPEDNALTADVEDSVFNDETYTSQLSSKQKQKDAVTHENEKTGTASFETFAKKRSKTGAIKKNKDDNDIKQEGTSCPICNRFYKLKRSLQQHIRNIHKPKKEDLDNKCTECGEQFSNLRELRLHMTNHISCDICGKSFTTKGNMTTHRKRHTGVKAYKCNECESSFYSKRELNKHMVCHSKKMPYMCEVCGRPCRDKTDLKGHMRRHTGERPAKCKVCGKCFFSNFDLNVHSVTHTTERPFACSICLSTFQTKKALRVHKKLHSSERRHECKVCHKTFAQEGALNTHMASGHTLEEKTFQLYDLIIGGAQF